MATPSDEGESEVQVSQEIDRSVADVFHWVADEHVRNHPRWDPDIELEQVTEEPIEVGTVIRRRNTRYETPVEGTMEVVEYEPEKAFGMVIKEGGFEMPGRITFDALGPERTKITIGTEVPASIDENLIQSKMERSARNMKDLAESDL